MVKKVKLMVMMVLMASMLANVSSVSATSWTQDTQSKGSLGKTSVTCTIDRRGGSSTYSQAYLSISTKNKVEKLGIKSINVVKKDGGGEMGKKVSKTNAYSASYTSSTYAPGSISSISANFYVTSGNFGNFSKNYSY